MSNAKSLGLLTAKLSQSGQQRLFEFLDVVDTETAARFRAWLSAAPDTELGAAADLLNRSSHGRDFAGWWRTHDTAPAPRTASPSPHRHNRTPFEHLHSQNRARLANRDVTVGGAWLVGGVLVTLGSYSLAANSPGGGTYVIASGAMLYGLLRLVRGLKAG